jgi:CHAT domain-containing protein/tetratricopeptide (TPR) repeat protein
MLCWLSGATPSAAEDRLHPPPSPSAQSLKPEIQTIAKLFQLRKYQQVIDQGLPLADRIRRQPGKDNPDLGNILFMIGESYNFTDRPSQAEPFLRESLNFGEKLLGPDHPSLIVPLAHLGFANLQLDHNSEAELLLKRSLALSEKAATRDDGQIALTLQMLANVYRNTKRFDAAEQVLKRSLAIHEKRQEINEIISTIELLADTYQKQGKFEEGAKVEEQALSIAQKEFGPQDVRVAEALCNIGFMYNGEGRYLEAIKAEQQALAIKEKALGPTHPDVVCPLLNLAVSYQSQGRYPDAESLLRRALAIREGAYGKDNPEVTQVVGSLGHLLQLQERYGDAETEYRRLLASEETATGPEPLAISDTLMDLAFVNSELGRPDQAELLVQRAIAIRKQALGADDPAVADSLVELGYAYSHQGKADQAATSYREALAIKERAFGVESSELISILTNLAAQQKRMDQYGEAEVDLKRALEITEHTVGAGNQDVAIVLSSLVDIYLDEGREAEAEPLVRRGLAIRARGSDTDVDGLFAILLDELSVIEARRNDFTDALTDSRKASTIADNSFTYQTRISPGGRHTEEQQLVLPLHFVVDHLLHLATAEQQRIEPVPALDREALQMAQWAHESGAAAAVKQMAARSRTDALARIVRERQDLATALRNGNRALVAASAKPAEKLDRAAIEGLRNEISGIESKLDADTKLIEKNFPDYAAFANPKPLRAEDIQKLLGLDEALVLFLDTPEVKPAPEETFIWIVTKTDVRWVRSALGTSALTREVAALRCGLDYQGSWFDEKGAWNGARCNDLLNATYSLWDYNVLRKPLPFDLSRAHALYKALFSDVEDLIKNKRLLIVPSGPLTQLPFQVLVTKPPLTALPASPAGYRDVAWLVREHAISVLPAVSSLKAVRELAKESHASEKYIGFGNPLLKGDTDKMSDEETRAKRLASVKLARDARCEPVQPRQTALANPLEGSGRITRGPDGLVAIADLNKWTPLPETAEEVCGVAKILGVDSRTHVYIGADAREKTVKRLSEEGELAKYKIVHFATHGALAGQLSPTAEPGLIMTPPDTASEVDDGYLSASEVAALKLDADWVILSACNTAAGEARSAEALSGLARAFFYAGSRSLLVSHWYVASKTAVPLITTAIAMLTVDPKIGRAEALRRSMLSMITSGKDYEAHPAFWAPFVLVGEGGAAR